MLLRWQCSFVECTVLITVLYIFNISKIFGRDYIFYFHYIKKSVLSGICRQIWKRGDTGDITPYSFLLGLLGASAWSVYGILEQHPVILYVNVTQLGIYTAYTVFYWTMSKKKVILSIQICSDFNSLPFVYLFHNKHKFVMSKYLLKLRLNQIFN